MKIDERRNTYAFANHVNKFGETRILHLLYLQWSWHFALNSTFSLQKNYSRNRLAPHFAVFQRLVMYAEAFASTKVTALLEKMHIWQTAFKVSKYYSLYYKAYLVTESLHIPWVLILIYVWKHCHSSSIICNVRFFMLNSYQIVNFAYLCIRYNFDQDPGFHVMDVAVELHW